MEARLRLCVQRRRQAAHALLPRAGRQGGHDGRRDRRPQGLRRRVPRHLLDRGVDAPAPPRHRRRAGRTPQKGARGGGRGYPPSEDPRRGRDRSRRRLAIRPRVARIRLESRLSCDVSLSMARRGARHPVARRPRSARLGRGPRVLHQQRRRADRRPAVARHGMVSPLGHDPGEGEGAADRTCLQRRRRRHRRIRRKRPRRRREVAERRVRGRRHGEGRIRLAD